MTTLTASLRVTAPRGRSMLTTRPARRVSGDAPRFDLRDRALSRGELIIAAGVITLSAALNTRLFELVFWLASLA
ncbi:hypothetical protein L6R49_11560 [Myxococcota bacterium]|nr:hypothetical protein [Myxococcota bacterium]